MLGGKLDTNILEGGRKRTNFSDVNAVTLELGAEISEIEVFFDQCVNRFAENGGAAYSRNFPRDAQRTSNFRCGDFDPLGSGRLHVRQLLQGFGRAVGDELSVIDVGNVIAALRFVHVVSGDEKSYALTGKFKEQIP